MNLPSRGEVPRESLARLQYARIAVPIARLFSFDKLSAFRTAHDRKATGPGLSWAYYGASEKFNGVVEPALTVATTTSGVNPVFEAVTVRSPSGTF